MVVCAHVDENSLAVRAALCVRTWINALAVRGSVRVHAFVRSFVFVYLCVRMWMKMLLQ